MTGSLGHAWINSYGQIGSEAFKIWCEELQDFTPQQITNGYSRYLKSGDSFLDLVKFRNYCEDLANKPPEQNRQAYLKFCDTDPEAEERFNRLTGHQSKALEFQPDNEEKESQQYWQKRLSQVASNEKAVGQVYLEMMKASLNKGDCKTESGLEKHLRILNLMHLMPSKQAFPS